MKPHPYLGSDFFRNRPSKVVYRRLVCILIPSSPSQAVRQFSCVHRVCQDICTPFSLVNAFLRSKVSLHSPAEIVGMNEIVERVSTRHVGQTAGNTVASIARCSHGGYQFDLCNTDAQEMIYLQTAVAPVCRVGSLLLLFSRLPGIL